MRGRAPDSPFSAPVEFAGAIHYFSDKDEASFGGAERPARERTLAPRILVVEDESDIRELLIYNLEAEGFDASGASDGEEALRALKEESIHLVVLDLMLPDMSGLEICRHIRRDSSLARLPVIMLTARGAEVDRIVGFELGADDYVTKPFNIREVVLRVKAVLARSGASAAAAGQALRRGALAIDPAQHEATVEGRPIPLTATEFRLLHHLAARPGHAQNRDELLDMIWGEDKFVTPRTVDTYVRRLREKLGPAGEMIETLRGVGYRFRKTSEP